MRVQRDSEMSWGDARDMLIQSIREGRVSALAWVEETPEGNPRFVYMGYAPGRLELLAYLEQLTEPPSGRAN